MTEQNINKRKNIDCWYSNSAQLAKRNGTKAEQKAKLETSSNFRVWSVIPGLANLAD